MRKSILLLGCSVLLAAPFFQAHEASAKNGDDNFIIAQGVPGAPQGGPTGTGGDSGVGDHDAGADRAQSYNTPAHPNSGNSSVNSVNDASDDQTRRHKHSHHTNDANNPTPPVNNSSGGTGTGNGMSRGGSTY